MSLPALVDNAVSELLEMPQADCNVVHFFAPGLCIREVTMKAGTFAVGQYQKYEHLNVLLAGRVRMIDEQTGDVSELCAPMIFIGKPGRKVGMILDDMVWQNIYATDLTDPDAVEDYFLDKNPLLDQIRLRNLIKHDDDDYQQMMDDVGYTQDMVDAECLRTDDMIPFPFGAVTVQVSDSAIHGRGLFATCDMKEGAFIPASISNKRTPAGRYTNHAKNPNCEAVILCGDIYWRLLCDLSGNKGGMVGDELTVDYRQVLRVKKCQQQ